jgi:hypothetical protein
MTARSSAREAALNQRVDFTCPHCTALVHATTLRDFRGSRATQLTLGNQALRAHLASCPKKPEVRGEAIPTK